MDFLPLLIFVFTTALFISAIVLITKVFFPTKKNKEKSALTESGFLGHDKLEQTRSSGFLLQSLLFIPIFASMGLLIPWSLSFRQTDQWELHIILLGVQAILICIAYMLIRLSGSDKWEN